MARPTNHLVIFVKAPRRGAVKTRLARTIGRAAAFRFYQDISRRLIRDLVRAPDWTTWLAVTPDRFAKHGRFWPPGIRRIGQGRGDLGARMARVLEKLPCGPVVIVGSDIPDVRRRHIAQAFSALRRHHAVFGPARDGGYWLVGHRRRPFVPDLFRNVAWSTDRALEQTCANVPQRQTVALLEKLEDVDDERAWRRWRSRRSA